MYFRKLRLRKISLGLIIAVTGGASQATTPNDTFFPVTSPGPNGLRINFQWALHMLNLEPAWELATGHAYLGMLESGIDINHPDLVGNFRPQFSYDFSSNDTNVDELDGETYLSAGHGTHVAGIMAAVTNNNTGTAGICWHCSLMVSKMREHSTDSGAVSTNRQAASINWLVNNGAQAINISYGGPTSSYLVDDNNTCDTLPSTFWGSINEDEAAAANYCDALAYAEEFDVVIAAASGNGRFNNIIDIQYPASDPRVIAVGAVDFEGSAEPDPNSIAVDFETPTGSPPKAKLIFSTGPEKDLVAPGFNILSTFYNDAFWADTQELTHPYFHPECADYIGPNTTNTPLNDLGEPQDIDYGWDQPRPGGGDGYGPCSGTSMAAPHVTGLVGLLRSINPLLKKDQIKAALINHASVDPDADPNPDPNVYGHGVPDALASVQDVLGKSNGEQLVNRLTPLFGLFSPQGSDHLYTTKPQMAMAAMFGELEPQPATKIKWNIDYDGHTIPGYSSFPKPGLIWDVPRASVYILTTHKNPVHPYIDLVPLYRLSRQRAHSWITNNVDHAYATTQAEVDTYIGDNYRLDGIEGYIFPTTYTEPTKPTGTVKLYRKKSINRDDTAIFPESQLSAMTSRGYTEYSGSEWIGWVYPNVDSDSDGVIDGFETILGTNIHYNDSDYDGISDGVEVNNYPYGDPKNPMVH